ncbi:uncharacterized protein LOC129276180 [Lytechinus pictus]|uniref:uncharacterized protein LOC129276180 n=1 Tax=Lytechinus pictus TaxID=7653 RepID=UPI0030B9D9AD
MESNNLLMKALLIEWGLLCCMSPCLSQAGACIDDRLNNQMKCRYKCQYETINEKCSRNISLQSIHHPIDGYCCPGFLLTSVGKCQVCPDIRFMPDINNCCHCIPCTQCDLIRNNPIKVPCTKTHDTVCHIGNTSGNPQIPVCPLIKPTSVDMTTETVLTYNISGDPTGKSSTSGNSRTTLILSIVITLVVIAFAIILITCIYCYKSGKICKRQGNAQHGIG